MNTENIVDCSIYIFDKSNKIIYLKDCRNYNPTNDIIIAPKDIKSIIKINNDNIKKTIMSIPNYKQKYFHISRTSLPSKLDDKQQNMDTWIDSDIYYNPLGIWLSCGISWQKYIDDVQTKWGYYTYLYQLEPTQTVLKISTLNEFKEFIEKYKKNTKKVSGIMNWKKIKQDYDGLIICPYLGNKIWGKNAIHMGIKGSEKWDEYVNKIKGNEWKDDIVFTAEWYRHWETGTGVIWKPSTGLKKIKLIKKLDTFDHEKI